MAYSRLLFFFCSILLGFFTLTIAQQPILDMIICSNDKGNFTANSTYQVNLNHLLSSLSDSKIDNGFYNASYGENQDRVNAMVLCRGDVKPESCKSCIINSTQTITKLCPNQKEAFIWYDECMLRYSYRYFFGNMESGPYFWMYSTTNVTNTNQFNEKVEDLLDDLEEKAATGGSLTKFATGNTTIPNAQTIYALVQCTPDLSEDQCSDCLSKATDLLPKCCDGRQGGRVISPSCHFRYEINLFYANTTANAPTPQSPTSQEGSLSPPPPATNTATQRGKESSSSNFRPNCCSFVTFTIFVIFVMTILENQ